MDGKPVHFCVLFSARLSSNNTFDARILYQPQNPRLEVVESLTVKNGFITLYVGR
jgi:hypothetical protein